MARGAIQSLSNYAARVLWPIGYIFSTWVFGQYALALGFALWVQESPSALSQLEPIRGALYAFMIVVLLSFVYLVLTKPQELWRLVIGALSIGLSCYTYFAVTSRLDQFVVPWWVSVVGFDPLTKIVITFVLAVAFLHILFGPYLFWKYPR
jgi:hypothetical protein